MIGPKLIEALVALLTIGSGLFALFLLVDLFRLKRREKGPAYKGGIGQWSWAAHRITGVGVIAFLFGHIVDTFGVGLGGHFYNETVTLYKQWWFNPFEVLLIGAVLYHALNGMRIILFDFWPGLALRQKTFAYVEFVLFIVGFLPAAVIMLQRAYELSPLAR
jgi:succinate dehydrogenase / fumarate reductase, cytochrome b subunit